MNIGDNIAAVTAEIAKADLFRPTGYVTEVHSQIVHAVLPDAVLGGYAKSRGTMGYQQRPKWLEFPTAQSH